MSSNIDNKEQLRNETNSDIQDVYSMPVEQKVITTTPGESKYVSDKSKTLSRNELTLLKRLIERNDVSTETLKTSFPTKNLSFLMERIQKMKIKPLDYKHFTEAEDWLLTESMITYFRTRCHDNTQKKIYWSHVDISELQGRDHIQCKRRWNYVLKPYFYSMHVNPTDLLLTYRKYGDNYEMINACFPTLPLYLLKFKLYQYNSAAILTLPNPHYKCVINTVNHVISKTQTYQNPQSYSKLSAMNETAFASLSNNSLTSIMNYTLPVNGTSLSMVSSLKNNTSLIGNNNMLISNNENQNTLENLNSNPQLSTHNSTNSLSSIIPIVSNRNDSVLSNSVPIPVSPTSLMHNTMSNSLTETSTNTIPLPMPTKEIKKKQKQINPIPLNIKSTTLHVNENPLINQLSNEVKIEQKRNLSDQPISHMLPIHSTMIPTTSIDPSIIRDLSSITSNNKEDINTIQSSISGYFIPYKSAANLTHLLPNDSVLVFNPNNNPLTQMNTNKE